MFDNQPKSITFINEYLEQTTHCRVVLKTINLDLANEYKSEANGRTGFKQRSLEDVIKEKDVKS